MLRTADAAKRMAKSYRSLLTLLVLTCLLGLSPDAHAQSTTRDQGWADASTATAVAAGVSALLMPRVFYSSPEATVGWKARWHVSALAPVMTHASLALFNEVTLKSALGDPQPGCEEVGTVGCTGFGLFSTQTYAATAALGHGVSVFIFDTMKYSGGRVHGGALAGHIILPLALTGITVAGRLAGNMESGEQVLATAGLGLVLGFAMGTLYSTMQAPNCGYSGSLICW